MTNAYDVAGRLAEGRPTIDDVEEYVAACRQLGYQHRDLTMHSTQVRDWYGSEDGLDLRALESDHGALSAAASAAEDAARRQTELVAELEAAWSGRGATSAHQFLWRSGESANTVSAALRAAADAVAALRDALWQAVDVKVSATEALAARQQPQRAQWLAAAKTVTTGAGDLAAASELIETTVKPFVESAVGSEWLPAMRAATSSVVAAYDAAVAAIPATPAVFAIPGELGPRAESGHHETAASHETGMTPDAVRSMPASVLVAAPTVPAAAVGSVPGPMPSVSTAPAESWSNPPPAALPSATDPMGSAVPPVSSSPMPSSGGLGTGTSPLGSGGSGFGQQLADLIGGLVGSADGLSDTAELDEPADLDDPDELEDPEEDDLDDDNPDDNPDDDADDDPDDGEDAEPDDGEDAEPGDTEGDAPAEPDAAEPVGAAAEQPAAEPPPTSQPPAPPAPTPPESPPAPQALPVVGVDDGDPTPCEIAADELPQVGE